MSNFELIALIAIVSLAFILFLIYDFVFKLGKLVLLGAVALFFYNLFIAEFNYMVPEFFVIIILASINLKIKPRKKIVLL